MLKDCDSVPYQLAMLDLDNFKQVNDTYGHQKGDRCLQVFGGVLREACGDSAKPFRFGGDEFCILFRGQEMGSAVETCRRIQKQYTAGAGSGGREAAFSHRKLWPCGLSGRDDAHPVDPGVGRRAL